MTTKERILQFIEYCNTTKTLFMKRVGLRRGFLDENKLHCTVSDIQLAAIVGAYPELSIEWLVTGKGDMLRSDVPAPQHKDAADVVSLERYEAKVEECIRLKMALESLCTSSGNGSSVPSTPVR